MRMYNLIKQSISYVKTSDNLWHCHMDDPNENITDSGLFKFNAKITRRIDAAGNKNDVEIAIALKYLSNSWRTVEMPLINCEINTNLVSELHHY